jgi:hypothetical protein
MKFGMVVGVKYSTLIFGKKKRKKAVNSRNDERNGEDPSNRF